MKFYEDIKPSGKVSCDNVGCGLMAKVKVSDKAGFFTGPEKVIGKYCCNCANIIATEGEF